MKRSIHITKIPEHLRPLPKIPFCTYRKYRLEYPIVPPLLELCSCVCDKQPLPDYWNWTPEEVADWVSEVLGYPEFKEAFLKNEIDGKGLIFLEADKFPRISIRRFHIIKALIKNSAKLSESKYSPPQLPSVLFYPKIINADTRGYKGISILGANIRKLCKLDQDEFKRSISLPIRKPNTLYLWYKASRTGPTAYFMTPSKYFRKINIIREEIADQWKWFLPENHWNRIPPFIEWCPHVMIGNNRRVNPMTGTTQRQNFHPKGHPYLLKDLCIYHLPCEDKAIPLK